MTFEVLNKYAEVNAEICQKNDFIPSSLFDEYGVNRGLRDLNGEGVLTGLSRISKIVSKKTVNGETVPGAGHRWYRGYRVETLLNSQGRPECAFEPAE